MGIKINQYPLERLTFGDDDFYDIDYWDGATYQTAKIKGSTIKAGIESGILTIYDNDGTLSGARTVDMNNFSLGFTGGSVGIEHDLTVFSNDPTKQWVATFIASSTNAVLAVQNINENVGVGTSAPATCSKLEVDSTDKGILIPRMTTTQRNAISGIEESLMIYNIDTNQFEYVDSSLNWVALGGGDSIYTADGTIGSGRIATLTDTLTYKGIGTSLGQRNLIITDINNDYILENYDNGYFKRTIRSGNNLGVIQNGAGTQGLWIQTSSELAGAGGLLIKNAKADTNYLRYYTDNFKAPDAQWYSNGQIHHRIRSNGTSSTVLSQVSFFINGFYGFGFNVGASAPIGAEDISLQGETVIKGNDTLSTSTALAIYDGDATPNKLWDFRNNGDVVLGQESTIDLDDNKLTFDVGTVASGTNPNIGLRVDGSNVYYGGGLNSSPLLQVDSDLGNVLNVNSGGYFIATSDYSTAIALFQKRGTNLGLSLASNKQAMGVPLIQHKPLLTSGSSQMIQQFVSSTLVDFQMINADGATGDNPNVKHWLRFGDSLSQASFFRTGFSGRGFIVGAQLVLGTEDISLQGETLIDGTLDMNNNRITNAVINPSVQETASTASFTVDADSETMGILTGMTQNVNVEAPTGTPVQGQKLMLRFKDDGTTRNFTWNIIWRAIGVTLPTATTANKTLYVGAVYNSTDSKWDVIAVKEEA